MFGSHATPPRLLHSSSLSDQASSTSRDTSPVTPAAAGTSPAKQIDKFLETFLWFQRRPRVAKATTELCVDSSLVDPDFDEYTFPQFGASPRGHSMAIGAAPNDNITIRQTSTSTRGNQPSDLTAGLRKAESSQTNSVHPTVMEGPRPSLAVPESSDMSRFENGARPISMKGRPMDKNRRESLAQSLGMGMSWGGASVGSWIRDE